MQVDIKMYDQVSRYPKYLSRRKRIFFSSFVIQKMRSIVDTLSITLHSGPVKFMFSKKATKIEKNLHSRFDTYLENVKLTVKIWSIFVAFLENMNFTVLGLWRQHVSSHI